MRMNLYTISTVLICSVWAFPETNAQCRQQVNCFMPKCYCSNKVFPQMRVKDIPQMVYFAFDDAVTPVVAKHYKRIFTPTRQNPNGCPIKMSLYISHNYTDYGFVRKYYKEGHEIAVHSVNHVRVDNEAVLYKEAKMQKEALAQLAGVQEKDIVGWRSPYLLSAGDDQPRILKQLGFKYDISLTYTRTSLKDDKMIWPFTLDYGWPHRCQIPECPKKSHPGFWEIPVISLMDKDDRFPCAYVDGCHSPPQTEQDAFDYLWNNFNSYYQGTRAPLGFHMHAAWFQYPLYDRVKVVNAFLDKILKLKDVYVITAKQMLEWMESPTPISHISGLKSWSCDQTRNNIIQHLPNQKTMLSPWKMSTSTSSLNPNKISQKQRINEFIQLEKTGTGFFSRKQNSQRNSMSNINQLSRQQDGTNQLNRTHNLRVNRFTSLAPELTDFSPISRWIQMKSRSSQTNLPWRNDQTFQRINTQMPIGSNSWHPFNASTTRRSEMAAVTHFSGFSGQNSNQSATSFKSVLGCQQNANCFLPKCFCKTTNIPLIPVYQRPQLILLNFDGPIHHSIYSKYETIFGTRVNPDRCPIRGTLFISARTNSSLAKRLHNMGLEISLRGLVDTSYRSYQKMRQDIINQVRSLTTSSHGLQMSDIKGWRSPSLKPVGDDQYKILKAFGFVYDSTLISKRVFNGKSGVFPFTLDYGWTEPCQQGPCPKNKHPELWEIPVSSLENIKHGHSCKYADGCPQPMLTAAETEEFLWRNFLRHYQSNRHPFSINLTQKWFHWHYHQNYQGLLNFIDRVLELGNVYFVSNTDAIKWIQSPVKWSEIPVRC